MNEKEVAEIRRRFKPEKNNISHIRGCFVNENKEIVSEFEQSLALMPEDESEKFLNLLKRTLSGSLDKNLLTINFTTQQVVDSEEHRLLMSLRDSQLKNEETLQSFYQAAMQTIPLEENYLILLAYDTYDIPFRSKDGATQMDASSEAFSYVLCSICPIKTPKPDLAYNAPENEFHNRSMDMVVSPPELGFMFPAFDDRSANIYNALYYTKSITENHQEFVDAIFGSTAPMPAAVQKETFQEILGSSLEDECDIDTVQNIQGHLHDMIVAHKERKDEIPLMVSKNAVTQILSASGVSEERLEVFDEAFDENFGADMFISPKNIVDIKNIEVTTPDVKITIAGDREDLLETRVIDGMNYILIRAEGGIELNGMPVSIARPEPSAEEAAVSSNTDPGNTSETVNYEAAIDETDTGTGETTAAAETDTDTAEPAADSASGNFPEETEE